MSAVIVSKLPNLFEAKLSSFQSIRSKSKKFFLFLSFFSVVIKVGAKSIEIVGPTDQIREGDVAVMQCIAYSSKPQVQIVWKNG